MHTVEELFREYVRAFSLPGYFGWNWAAFDECMSELEESRALLFDHHHSRRPDVDQAYPASPPEARRLPMLLSQDVR